MWSRMKRLPQLRRTRYELFQSGLEQYASTKTVIVSRLMLLSMRLKLVQLKSSLPTRKTRSQLDKIS